MSAVIWALLGRFWQPIAAVLAGVALYLKGRSDKAKTEEIKDLRHAQDIRQRADEARAAADSHNVGDGLRKSDGWKRD